MSAEQAACLVRDNDTIVVAGCGAAPIDFLSALAQRTDLSLVYVSHATAWGALPHLSTDNRPDHIDFRSYFLPAAGRQLYRQQKIDYVPLTFSHMQAMYDAGDLSADVVAVTCSTPDAEGYCSLGPFVSYLPAAMRCARQVIGECSPNWPHTRGAARVHVSQFDSLVDVTRSPITSSVPEPDAVAQRIGQHVVSLIPNGATVQIGRGAIPSAIAAGLAHHKDLGVHSEMISDWIVDLVEAGVITGARKSTNRGEIITSFMDGSSRLYDFVSRCEALRMEPIYEVNNPELIGREQNFLAINSAIEIDLMGQINAESVNGYQISGSGGLLDFALGAAISDGGKFVVALPSTASEGAISRVVARLKTGAAVTVPRALSHYVVTEYGIANVRGCTLAERARRLIAIAHPSYRDELSRTVNEMRLQ